MPRRLLHSIDACMDDLASWITDHAGLLMHAMQDTFSWWAAKLYARSCLLCDAHIRPLVEGSKFQRSVSCLMAMVFKL